MATDDVIRDAHAELQEYGPDDPVVLHLMAHMDAVRRWQDKQLFEEWFKDPSLVRRLAVVLNDSGPEIDKQDCLQASIACSQLEIMMRLLKFHSPLHETL